MRKNSIDWIFRNYNRQDFKLKEMIIILNNNKMNLDNWMEEGKKYKNVRIFQLDENIPLGTCLNYGLSYTKYNTIAKFDDDDYYGPKYLSDSIKVFKETQADIVGKATSYVYFKNSNKLAIISPKRENKYVKRVYGSTLLVKRKVFNKLKFSNISKGVDTQFAKDCTRNRFKIYSTNRYHYTYIRSGIDKDHTWKISDEELLKYCTVVKEDIEDFREFVNV